MDGAINTDRELHSLKPQSARYERAIARARGLSVLVFPNGLKSFVVRYVSDTGFRRRMPIGDFPAVTLAEARLKAGGVRLEVIAGKDPAGERAIARAEARLGETLEELATNYWTAAAIGLHGGRKRPLRPETIARQKALWNRHLKPLVGGRRYRGIRRADVRALMQDLVLTGKLSASSIASIGDVLRALFAYALHEDLVEANPTQGLTRPITPLSRSRLFGDDALALILARLLDASQSEEGRSDPRARMAPHMGLALRFMILTLTRRTETAAAGWQEIDLATRTWIIPPERTKNRQFHVVPLSSQAIEVLKAARALSRFTGSAFLFPSPADPARHLDPHAMTRAINRTCTRLGLPLGSPHDFRRTGATTLTGERYGVRRFIISKVLGHTAQEGATVTSVYDRNDYLAEKRQALEAWSEHIAGLIPQTDMPDPGRGPHLRVVSAN